MVRARIGLLIGVIGILLGVVMFGGSIPPNATPALAATVNFSTNCWGFRLCSKVPVNGRCAGEEAPVSIVALTKQGPSGTTGVAWVNEVGIQTVYNFSVASTALANGGTKVTWTLTSCVVNGDCPGFGVTHFVGVPAKSSTEFGSISTDSDRSLVCDGKQQ